MDTLVILNLIASSLILVLLGKQYLPRKKGTRESFEQGLANAISVLSSAQEWVEFERQARLSKPIHHPKATGPTTAKITTALGYWRPKEDPKAEPFLAAWYERDTTGETDFVPIPADTYIDLMGRRITGAKFRSLYEPSEAVMEVSKFKPKNQLRNANLVTAKATQTISDEEEQKLAEEYELGGHVSDRAP
jgi:hypothetical protein